MSLNKKQAEKFRRMTTTEFAEWLGWSKTAVAEAARQLSLRKTRRHIQTVRKNAAHARWSRRVLCARDENGLAHEISSRTQYVFNPRLRSKISAQCGKSFYPLSAPRLDFVACEDCKEVSRR